MTLAAPPETEVEDVVELYEGIAEAGVPWSAATRPPRRSVVLSRDRDRPLGARPGPRRCPPGRSARRDRPARSRRGRVPRRRLRAPADPARRGAPARRRRRTRCSTSRTGWPRTPVISPSAPGCRIVIDLERVPLAAGRPSTTSASARTSSCWRPSRIAAGFAEIGRCEEGEGVELLLDGRPIELSGYRHFGLTADSTTAVCSVSVLPRWAPTWSSGCPVRECCSSGWRRSRSSSSSSCRTRHPAHAAGAVLGRAPLGTHGSVVHEYVQFSRNRPRRPRHLDANGHSVTTILTDRGAATAGLVLGGAVIWLAIAIPLGLLAALRPRLAQRRRAGCSPGRRSLAAAALARAPPLVGVRRPARLVSARWLLRHARPGARLRRAAAVGVPHGAALDRVRADLRVPSTCA